MSLAHVLRRLTALILTVFLLAALGGWDESDIQLAEYLGRALQPKGGAVRFYFSTRCEPKTGFPGFPKVNLRLPQDGITGIGAVKQVFQEEPTALITEGADSIVRITMGTVSPAILQTRIHHLALDSTAQYDEFSAIDAIEESSEVQAAMLKNKLRLLPTMVDVLLRGAAPGMPHLPASIDNMTVDQALDMVATTLKDLVIYGVCTQSNGTSTFFIESEPLTLCNENNYADECLDPRTDFPQIDNLRSLSSTKT